jgi:2-polyprenyl-3-methyl-5-hydroxy-6-metoxy-1,4-benzoquinol methylase
MSADREPDPGYDALAGDYHWLIPDALLSGDYTVERLGPLLGRLSPGARILDCACGSGTDALALAHHGYRVWGIGAPHAVAVSKASTTRLGQSCVRRLTTYPETASLEKMRWAQAS